MAGELTTLFATHGPDIAKALAAGVLGLAVYIWHQREKSIDGLETEMQELRDSINNRFSTIGRAINNGYARADERGEERIKLVYNRIEQVKHERDLQVQEMERRLTSNQAETARQLAELIGEHKATHKSQSPGGNP